MAGNTIQFGITLDTSTVASGASEIQAKFEQTTSEITNQWTQTSSTIASSLEKMAAGAEQAAGRTKEQIDKASSAASALGDVVGIKVPEGMQKMVAESELIGPSLEAAFAPLAVIQLVQWLAEASDKLSKFIADTFIYTQADKDAVSQIAQENKVLGELAEKTKEVIRARQLLQAPDEASKIKLNLQFQIEDQGGSAENFTRQIDEVNSRLDVLRKKSQEKFPIILTDDFGNTVGELRVLTEEARRSQEELQQLGGRLLILQGLEKKAAAEEALAAVKGEKAQAAAKQAALEQAARAAAQARAAKAAAEEQAAREFKNRLDDELTAEKQTHLLSIEEELHFWQSKLAAAARFPEVFRTIQNTMAGIDQQIFAQHEAAAQQEAQRQEEANQRAIAQALSDDKAKNDAIIAHGKELLDAQASLYKRDIENAKVNEEVKVQLAEADLARGKIAKQREIQIVAAAKKEEIRLEIQAWQAIQAIYDDQPKKVAEIELTISKLRGQARLAEAKAIADSAKATESTYKQLWTSIGNTFKSTLDGLIQAHETLAQAVQKLLTGLLADIANYLEQKAVKEAAALATSLIHTKAEATSTISAESGKAFAAAYADMASTGPEGLAAAPGVAAAAASATLSGGLGLLTSLDIGTWNVPFDMPAQLHSGEIVVPRFESDLFRNAVRAGGQGANITVVVNHSVSAIDAQSFQGTIRKNSNLIANEIGRALRKKGLGVS
jgi:hypothetical protein